MRPGLIIIALWIGFTLSWVAAAAWQARTEKVAGVRAELGHRIILLAGTLLLLVPAHNYRGPLRLWAIDRIEAWIVILLISMGFAFCWWARIHLGSLWSPHVTKKAEHRVIDSGPYGIVRHPIYTGILLAVFATAAAKGTVLGLAGAVLIAIGFTMKARLEERWLRQELGPEAYDAYRRRVPMLLPFASRA